MRYSKIFMLLVAISLFVVSCKEENVIFSNPTIDELRGTITSVEKLATYNLQQIDSIINEIEGAILPSQLNPISEVDLFKVTYRTTNFNDNLVYATGAIAIPKDSVSFVPPISTYCHGTAIQESNVPSAQNLESAICIIFASEGIITAMPDYLGFGTNSIELHGYHIAKTEASATIDIMKATMQYLDNNNIEYNNEHYVFGYSQGGHAAMATVKAIEESEQTEINLVAAAPMSGAYDLSGIQATTFTNDEPYDAPYYLPFILLAFNETYNLFENYSDFLVAPYDSLLPPMFDGFHSPSEIDAIMPKIPNQIIIPSVLKSFKNDPNHKLRKALEENNLNNWTPKTDMKIYYCEGDNLVLFENSLTTCANFANNGSTADIECVKGEDFFGGAFIFNHTDCVLPSLLQARIWLLDLAD